jgi:hypothetical protein
MSDESPIIELAAHIDENNQLSLTFQDLGRRVALRPGAGLADLLALHPGASSITLEVRDFFQCGAVYDVYGANLAADGRVVESHWQATGHGQRSAFAVVSAAEARKVKVVVGATPRRPGAPVPVPFASWQTPSGSLPTDEDPKKGDLNKARL